MKIIIGLGNPGSKYSLTRHNIGFEVIDYMADKYDVSLKSKHKALIGTFFKNGKKVMLVKPQTFMNLSGESIFEIMDYYDADPQDMLVVYDDIDLESGRIRLRAGGSGGTHNGMRSIIFQTQTNNIPRLRIGVGKPEIGDLAAYVLGKFSPEEKERMKDAVIKAEKAAGTFIEEGIYEAMNKNN